MKKAINETWGGGKLLREKIMDGLTRWHDKKKFLTKASERRNKVHKKITSDSH